MTKEELDAKLKAQIAAGEITPDEAEDEWHDFVERGEGRWGWGWTR